jgi:acetyl esterase/lipase
MTNKVKYVMINSLCTIILFVGCGLFSSCNKDNPEQESTVPSIETVEISNISTTSAVTGGTVTSDGGELITLRGVCWSASPNPTVTGGSYVADLGQSASFSSIITGLSPNTTYHVRAFAINSIGTAYGNEISFTTRDENNGDTDDPSQTEIFLWQEGNMPATTSRQTVANSSNPDGPDFRPNMVYYPAKQGITVKGAVLVCPGGAFAFRSGGEGAPVAEALSELGYQSFVVNYRLRPYTQQEGALDLARAVRFVRLHAEYYGIDTDDIVVAGFSAGGILCGEQVLNYRGTVNGSSLDSRYVPDDLDKVSADVKGIGHIYSFYGRLSVASTDVELFRRSNLPPAFFCYGTNDPFANQFAACVNALRQADVSVETHVLQGWPHGYGSRGDWIPVFDAWLQKQFNR